MRGFLKLLTLFFALDIGTAHASTGGSLRYLIEDYQSQMTTE